MHLKYLLVLCNEKGGVILNIELNPSGSNRGQEIVVDEIISTQSNQDQSIVYQLPRLFYSDETYQSPLVLFEIIQLLPDPYYVHLPKPHGKTVTISNIIY